MRAQMYDVHVAVYCVIYSNRCTRTESPPLRMSPYMLVGDKGHNNTMLVYDPCHSIGYGQSSPGHLSLSHRCRCMM